MVIGLFHCAHVVKSIPWTVIGRWPRNGHIYTSLFSCNAVSVLAHYIFVNQLDASWNP